MHTISSFFISLPLNVTAMGSPNVEGDNPTILKPSIYSDLMGSSTSYSTSITVPSLENSLTEPPDHSPDTLPNHSTLPSTLRHTSFTKTTPDYPSCINPTGNKLNTHQYGVNAPNSSFSQGKTDKPLGLHHTLLLDKQSPYLTLMLINARSVQSKMTYLRTLLLLNNPSLVLITESWLSSDTTDTFLQIDTYELFRCDRVIKKGGGCLVYVSKNLRAETYSDHVLSKLPESIWLTVHTHECKILIGCIYRAPNTPSSTDTIISESFAQAASLDFTYKIVCGDFNLPTINWKTHSGPLCFESILRSLDIHGWQQHVHLPTRNHNILDLIFCHGVTPTSMVVSEKFHNSDHKIVLCTLPILAICNKLKTLKTRFQYRDYANADWENFRFLIKHSDWGSFFTSNNLLETLEIFNITTKSALDTTIPSKIGFKTVTPYINQKTRSKLRKLKRMYYISKDFSALHQIYSVLDGVQSQHNKHKQVDERTALAAASKAQALCRLLTKRIRKNTDNNIHSLLHDGVTYNDQTVICELLSEWFSHNGNTPDAPDIDIKCTGKNYLSTINFDIRNIHTAIKTLKPNASSGADDIPSIVYKMSGPDIQTLLLKIYTLSLETGTYPETWKVTYVLPKHKSGPRNLVENYRPINITPVISRIMEKVIQNQLSDHLLKEDLIDPSQHGFIRTRSCSTCLIDFFNEVTRMRDQKKLVIILYFDIKKAFDKVPHNLLINRLKSVGIINPLLQWIKSFLTNRYQITKINSNTSTPRPITSGVVQGSVLGPLLFIIYINNICRCFSTGKTYLYADDLKVIYKTDICDLRSTMQTIQHELNMVDDWCKRWRLELNIEKCGWLCIGDTSLKMKLTISDHTLPRLASVTDLGVHYSHSLNFSEHITAKASKMRKLLGFILRNFYQNESKILLYKVCVRPIVEYCSFLFSNLRLSDILKVEGIQRDFTRKVLKTDSVIDYSSRCQILGIAPLWKRRLRSNLILYFKLLKNLTYSTCQIILARDSHEYELRNKVSTVKVEKYRSKTRENFFLTKYAIIWNSLPSETRMADELHTFVKLLDQALTRTDLARTNTSAPHSDIIGSLHV
ncbi:unnamed protein product [Schistosoma intercalatum]|nr:unnamed protein product [Schistosoma intercalatum]